MKPENMKEKAVRLPGTDHPISIERNPARVVVSVAGLVVADSRNFMTLREATYPPVLREAASTKLSKRRSSHE